MTLGHPSKLMNVFERYLINIPAGFELLSAPDEAVAFAKQVPGDTYFLQIDGKASVPGEVTVRFTASPE